MRIGKKPLLLVVALVLALGLASQAVAAPTATASEPTQTAQTFGCSGTVTAVDPAAGTMMVTVRHATVALQGFVGQSLTLTATETSLITRLPSRVTSVGTLAKVAIGSVVEARGWIDASDPSAPVYDLARARVWQRRVQARFTCRGTVSSIDLQANALVVRVRHNSSALVGSKGKDVTIDLAEGTKIVVIKGQSTRRATISDITAGDHVRVVGLVDRTNASAPVLTAKRVIVRHVVPVDQLKWYACSGNITAVDSSASTLTISVLRATCALRAQIGESLMLTSTSASVIRTLSNGYVTTLPVSDAQVGESISARGSIDRTDPDSPVYVIGHAFVWQP